MTRPTQITIDLSALQHNVQQVRKMAPHSSIIAMVKANAYGHGLERIASALSDVEALGVACCEEGLILRAAGIKNPIVLMEGLFATSELDKAVENNFTLVVHQVSQVEMLEKHPISKPLSIWLKIDTGMHRLGFAPSDVAAIHARLMDCAAVKKPIGLMTHFADSDSADHASTLQQIEIFNAVTHHLEGPRSLANSAGVIAWPSTHAEWVRPGIMLYGASPFIGQRGVEHHLRPVMTLTSELIAIHEVVRESRVGYGGTWVCPEDMRVGVVGMGYGDGYPRHAQNGTPVLVNGRPCSLAGRVSMDMITLDLRTQPDAKVGDPVLLWGPNLPVEVVAEYSDTNAYELLTRITQRVHVEVKTAP